MDGKKSLHKSKEYIAGNKIYFCVFLGVVLVFVILAIFIHSRKFRLWDYVTVSYEGADGYAMASFTIDEEKLYRRLAGEKPDSDKDYHVRKLIESIVCTTGQRDIKNGDKVEVTIDFDEGYEQAVGVNLGKHTYRYKAKGISKGTSISLFDNIDVMFVGISPDATVTVTNNWDDEYLKTLTFTVDKTENIRLGDVINVTCNTSYEDMARKGFVTDETSAAFTADRLSVYCDSVNKIDSGVMDTITSEMKNTILSETGDTTFRMLFAATSNSDYLTHVNEETAENVQILNKYYLSKKDQSGKYKNYIYIAASAEIKDNESEEKVYFLFQYSNAYITADGRFDINHELQNKRYVCGVDLDLLYNENITGKENEYTVISF